MQSWNRLTSALETGPNAFDRGKYGSKIHLVSERTGLLIWVGISGSNLHDSRALAPMVRGISSIRSRRGLCWCKPAELHADKVYDNRHLRRWLRYRHITPCVARKGIESSQRLGRHCRTIERHGLARRMPAPAFSSAAADSLNETISQCRHTELAYKPAINDDMCFETCDS
ncbi:transposase [Streptomyces sp. NPDC088747]|uniref:transposase n=1 Tax=Streptomyces sp. NPDC088747 TaxID=3365886 RepID=UPI003821CB7A